MTNEELLFFEASPASLPLYIALRERLLGEFPDTTVKTAKTQITFRSRYGYAFVSLRRMKGCGEGFIIVSFGLSEKVSSPRIAVAVEPYPNRWTHHVIVNASSEIDEELMGWLRAAHDFALRK